MKFLFEILAFLVINAHMALASTSKNVAAFATPSIPPSDPPSNPPSNPPSQGPPSGVPKPVYRYPGAPRQPSYPSQPSYPQQPSYSSQPSSGMPPIFTPPSGYPPILSPPESISYEPIQPVQPPYSEPSYPSGTPSYFNAPQDGSGQSAGTPPQDPRSDIDPSQRPIFPQDTDGRNRMGMYPPDGNQGPGYRPDGNRGPRYPGDRSQGPRYPGDRMQGPRYPGDKMQGPRYPGDRSQGPRYPGDRMQGPRYPGDKMQGPRYPGDRMQGPRYPGDRMQGPRYPGDRDQGPRYAGDRNRGPRYPPDRGQGQGLRYPQGGNQYPMYPPIDGDQNQRYPSTSIPPDPSLPYGSESRNQPMSYPAPSYPSSPYQSPSYPPVATSSTSYAPIGSTGTSRSNRTSPPKQQVGPSPPISMPVWSLACPVVSTGETSMNIVTFATAVSVGPPKLWMVSLYNHTLTRDSFLESKVGILQLLSSSMPDLVPVLGQRSGYEEGYSKRRECRNLIHSWVSSDFEFPTKEGGTATLDLLPECALYVQLRLLSTTEAADHDMALCEVIGTGIWNRVTKRVVATDSFPTALDPVRVLYTQQLRDERII